MESLNFPRYQFRLKNNENKRYIFDDIRKKFVVLQPEEWVRQHVLKFLMLEKKYPRSLINVEKVIHINKLRKRYDIVVFNPDGSIAVVVECKSPNMTVTQQTFNQIARYNLALKASCLMVTNGKNHYFCRIDYENERYIFLKELPEYRSRSDSS